MWRVTQRMTQTKNTFAVAHFYHQSNGGCAARRLRHLPGVNVHVDTIKTYSFLALCCCYVELLCSSFELCGSYFPPDSCGRRKGRRGKIERERKSWICAKMLLGLLCIQLLGNRNGAGQWLGHSSCRTRSRASHSLCEEGRKAARHKQVKHVI